MQRLTAWSGVVVSLVLGCGGKSTQSHDNAVAGDGSGGSAGNGGATSSCSGCEPLEQCWNGKLCVAKTVAVTAGFSIDATEVTRNQYAAWIATEPATSGQSSACSWNADFAPDPTCMAESSVCKGAGCAQHPQPCVDLCDAAAYCKAVGKRLCAGLGGTVLAHAKTSDATKSEWYNACTSNGVNRFSYGNSMVWGKCADGTSNFEATVPVGSQSECQSSVAGYSGVYDLIGNVWEWEDNCDGTAGAADICNPRGHSFGISAAMQECSQGIPMTRAAVRDNIGFRCCAS